MRVLQAALTALLLTAACGAASAQEKIVFTTMSPAGSSNFQFFTPWADKINAEAKGAFSLQLAPTGPLANFSNVYERVQDDVVQIGWLVYGQVAGQFPLSEVGGLPFIVDGAEIGSVAFWRLYKSGALDAEHKDVVPLIMGIFSPSAYHLAKAPRSLDDLAGLKIAAFARTHSDMSQRLGASALSIPIQDLYEGLQRSTIDGVIIGWNGLPAFKLQEVTSYHIMAPTGATSHMIFFGKKKFNALPEAARKVLDDNGGEGASRALGKFFDTGALGVSDSLAKDGKRTVVRLNPNQVARWRTLVEPVLDDWAKSRTRGPEILAAYKAFVADAQKSN